MELIFVLPCLYFSILYTVEVSGIRLSEKKCNEYRNIVLPATSKEFNETVEDAVAKEFPFTAIIMSYNISYNGILISDNFVLSTAMSHFFRNSADKIYVVLGDLEINSNKDDSRLQTYDVIKVIPHPDFNYSDRTANIKLYKLNETVRLDEYVLPACLPPFSIGIPQQVIKLDYSNRLQKYKMNYVLDERCEEIYKSPDLSNYVNGIKNGTAFCARSTKYNNLPCGVRAAVLISADRKAFNEVFGIESTSFYCDDRNPSVFVRLTAYIDWIESIVWSGPNANTTTETGTGKSTQAFNQNKVKTVESETERTVLIAVLTTIIIALLLMCTVIVGCKMKSLRNLQNTMNVQLNMNIGTDSVEMISRVQS